MGQIVNILPRGRREHITVKSQWAPWRLKSPASWLFAQPFVQAHIKENFKAQRHWPLWGEFTGDRWIPLTKGQWRGNCFHSMTSSCIRPTLSNLWLPMAWWHRGPSSPGTIRIFKSQQRTVRFTSFSHSVTFYLHGLTLTPTWIRNHMPRQVWDEITYRLPYFKCWSLGIDK